MSTCMKYIQEENTGKEMEAELNYSYPVSRKNRADEEDDEEDGNSYRSPSRNRAADRLFHINHMPIHPDSMRPRIIGFM